MMRRNNNKPNGGYNNQHRKPRYQQGGHGGRNNHGGHRGPRRNWPAAQAKYLEQARSAIAAGDRVMAEYYYQHADHCYRMMVEEGQNRPNYTPPPAQNGEAVAAEQQPQGQESFPQENTSQLPAFLTANYQQPEQAAVDPATVQNWEERDA